MKNVITLAVGISVAPFAGRIVTTVGAAEGISEAVVYWLCTGCTALPERSCTCDVTMIVISALAGVVGVNITVLLSEE